MDMSIIEKFSSANESILTDSKRFKVPLYVNVCNYDMWI